MAPKTDYTGVFKESISHPSWEKNALMDIGMLRESPQRKAILPKTDPETFMLLLVYAYTRDYQPGTPVVIKLEQPSEQEELRFCQHCGRRTRKVPGLECNKLFYVAAYAQKVGPRFCGGCGKVDEICGGHAGCDDFSYEPERRDLEFLQRVYKVGGSTWRFKRKPSRGNIVQQVKLYLLADQYKVKSLKELCLAKLHQELCLLNLNEGSMADVCDLIKFVNRLPGDVEFTHDVEPTIESSLKDLVVSFILFQAGKLVLYREFQSLLASGGAFVSSFAIHAVRRLDDQAEHLTLDNFDLMH